MTPDVRENIRERILSSNSLTKRRISNDRKSKFASRQSDVQSLSLLQEPEATGIIRTDNGVDNNIRLSTLICIDSLTVDCQCCRFLNQYRGHSFQLSHLGKIPCENCHGPGLSNSFSDEVKSPKKPLRNLDFGKVPAFLLTTSLASFRCGSIRASAVRPRNAPPCGAFERSRPFAVPSFNAPGASLGIASAPSKRTTHLVGVSLRCGPHRGHFGRRRRPAVQQTGAGNSGGRRCALHRRRR